MNKVILIGRLSKVPELRYAPTTGKAITRFTLAISRPFKKDEADFINCIAFGKTGETIAEHLTKGRQAAVTGSIRSGSYVGQDGIKRYTTDIAVESFEFIGNSKKDENRFGEDTQFNDGFIPEDMEDGPF